MSVKELLPSAFRFDPKDKVASTSELNCCIECCRCCRITAFNAAAAAAPDCAVLLLGILAYHPSR